MRGNASMIEFVLIIVFSVWCEESGDHEVSVSD